MTDSCGGSCTGNCCEKILPISPKIKKHVKVGKCRNHPVGNYCPFRSSLLFEHLGQSSFVFV